MDLPYLLRQLAQSSKNPALLDALIRLKLTPVNEALAQNPNLSLTQRAQLLAIAKLNLAKLLTQSATGDDQLRQILADKRITLHLFLFMYGAPGASDALCQELIPKLTQAMAYNWVASYNPPKRKYLKDILSKSYPYQTLRYLADRTLYTDEEVLHQLTTLSLPNRGHLPELLDTRPNFIPTIFALVEATLPNHLNPAALIYDLAHCRHIFDQASFTKLIELSKNVLTRNDRNYFLGYLAKNPNVAPATLQLVIDILQRSRANSAHMPLNQASAIYQAKTTNPDLTATQDWQTLPPGPTKDLVASFISSVSADSYPTLKPKISYSPTTAAPLGPHSIRPIAPQQDLSTLYIANLPEPLSSSPRSEHQVIRPDTFTHLVEPELTPLGSEGWDIFLALATTWQSSVADLINSTRTALLS